MSDSGYGHEDISCVTNCTRILYTWYIVYGKLGLRNITLGVRKDKPNVAYCIGHILDT